MIGSFTWKDMKGNIFRKKDAVLLQGGGGGGGGDAGGGGGEGPWQWVHLYGNFHEGKGFHKKWVGLLGVPW